MNNFKIKILFNYFPEISLFPDDTTFVIVLFLSFIRQLYLIRKKSGNLNGSRLSEPQNGVLADCYLSIQYNNRLLSYKICGVYGIALWDAIGQFQMSVKITLAAQNFVST